VRTLICLLAVTLTSLQCVAQEAGSASIAGVVMAGPGNPVAAAKVELHSRTQKFEGETDFTGYDLKVSRRGFYPEEEKDLPVSAGLEQVYARFGLDKCPNGNCDPKLRRIKICE
jgi:hypothetical protein